MDLYPVPPAIRLGQEPPPSGQTGVREQLDRILNSERFQKSPQLSRFLRFCVEQTLLGNQDKLKEIILGIEVFRREPFDPRLDPIVRVEARRLRSKLDEYYAAEGSGDAVVISFQRGDYIPRFLHTVAGSERLARNGIPASVLIVEDERLVAHDLENRLRGMGYDVVGSVASGEAALLMAETHRPDIVLMDILLAGAMQGTEVARRIWNRWNIPVVYLTAFSDSMVVEDIKQSEPYGYILKPFDPKQVHVTIQLALSRHQRAMDAPLIDRGIVPSLP
jgi:CheY-like chemotaxis protein